MTGNSGRRRMVAVAAVAAIGILAVAGGLLVRNLASEPACEPTTAHPEWSVARHWNEALLAAIARDLPAPTVHSRNLFHLSVAMWDAWAAYDPSAAAYLVDEEHEARDVEAARAEAMSYAAHRVLEARYLDSIGASDSIPQFDRLLEELCYSREVTTTDGDSPAALGNRIAAAVLASGAEDHSNEEDGYAPVGYEPINPPLVVDDHVIEMTDPDRWQPLQLAEMMSQNGIWIESGVQEFIGPHWGHVSGFALPAAGADGLPLDPGPPPRFADPATRAAFVEAAVEVIRYTSWLDPDDGETIDISPGARGANPLDGYDGPGHDRNPVTGAPYEPNLVSRADFARALTEYWADGPRSETPPGHWNTIANEVSDTLDPDLRLGGVGDPLDRLEWDVKLYLALNGANHDAAIAAWGAKGHYDYARPISMIWYLGSLGQSSDPDAPSFHPDGLPLEEGLIELVTEESTAPGERHEHLAGREGELAIRAWSGSPDDREHEVGGVSWVAPTEWIPYQLPTFVTPSFAGYVSGHSTFSRASAEVLTAMTGDAFFPGGLRSWTMDHLEVEAGPSEPVTLQAATYQDAADQAGLSRLLGGIHVRADDLAGRALGERIGRACWDKARSYFGDVPGG